MPSTKWQYKKNHIIDICPYRWLANRIGRRTKSCTHSNPPACAFQIRILKIHFTPYRIPWSIIYQVSSNIIGMFTHNQTSHSNRGREREWGIKHRHNHTTRKIHSKSNHKKPMNQVASTTIFQSNSSLVWMIHNIMTSFHFFLFVLSFFSFNFIVFVVVSSFLFAWTMASTMRSCPMGITMLFASTTKREKKNDFLCVGAF